MLTAIPIYNEYNYIDEILEAVHHFAKDILVVDDGSTDGTSDVLREYDYIRLIRHERNLGYGRGIIDIFEFAKTHNFNWVITLDCDYQHEPCYIPHFFREISKEDSDVISGSRYLSMREAGSIAAPKERIAINERITEILNENLVMQLTDSFCGFKAYKVHAISKLKLEEQGYGFPLQFWIRAVLAGLRIREIPVPLIYHNSKRDFAGNLQDPKLRYEYYREIIERELGKDVIKDPPDFENT